MCASCGCGKVDDQMGDDRHLTMSDLKSAAEAAEISVQEVAKNIQAAAAEKGQESNGNAQAQGAGAAKQTPGAAQQQGQGMNGEAKQPAGAAPAQTPGAARQEQTQGTR